MRVSSVIPTSMNLPRDRTSPSRLEHSLFTVTYSMIHDRDSKMKRPATRFFPIVAIFFLAPSLAYGHVGGGFPHSHSNWMELLLVWLLVVIALLPTGLLKRR